MLQPPVHSTGSSQFAHESHLCCPALLCASLQVLSIGVFRFRPYMDWLTVLWLAAYCGGVTAQAALRRRHRSLYLRLRPYTAAAFRAAGLGLGCATLLKQRMLEDGLHAAPPNGHVDNAVVSMLRIVFTSGGATMLLFAFGWQTWLRWVEGRVVWMLWQGIMGIYARFAVGIPPAAAALWPPVLYAAFALCAPSKPPPQRILPAW